MKWLTPVLLAAMDAVGAMGCLVVAIWLRNSVLPAIHLAPQFQPVRDYATLWPALVLLLAARTVVGLYPGYGRTAPEELRLQTLSTVLVISFVFAGSALFRFSGTYSRFVLGSAAILVMIALPLTRAMLKQLLARYPFYGHRVAVLGRGPRTDTLRSLLHQHRTLGLRPVEADEPNHTANVCLLIPDQLETPLPDILYELSRRFPRVLLAPDLLDVASVWVTPHDVSGHLALEVRNNLWNPVNRTLKRGLDIGLALFIGALTSPIMLVVAVLVATTSRGPVFVRHQRVGKDGREFSVYKFRTMHKDAARQLEELLASSESARSEWEATRKLRRDPRITTLGRFLRASSADELPQLLNVLRGDMSLVGPRPIVQDELALYGGRARLYLDVRPGLTGLMQVSGRNDLTYDERVRLDAYYVRNWSVWLDIVIMARTAVAVARRDGAY